MRNRGNNYVFYSVRNQRRKAKIRGTFLSFILGLLCLPVASYLLNSESVAELASNPKSVPEEYARASLALPPEDKQEDKQNATADQDVSIQQAAQEERVSDNDSAYAAPQIKSSILTAGAKAVTQNNNELASIDVPLQNLEKSIVLEKNSVARRPVTLGLPQVQLDRAALHKEGQEFFQLNADGSKTVLTLRADLQEGAEAVLKQSRAPWSALVVMEPRTGKILALAGNSADGLSKSSLEDGAEGEGMAIATRATFPAASLFKIITAAAAIEKAGLSSDSVIQFRGGNYTLGTHNYLPDRKKDKRVMKLASAMGLSCNPVFARVALNNLSVTALEQYAFNFGFNRPLPCDFPVEQSSFHVENTEYELARTAAGFGAAYISPVHAAAFTGAIANQGLMMKPYLIDRLVDAQGLTRYRSKPAPHEQIVLKSTAHELMDMMYATVTEGTARKHFGTSKTSSFRNIRVAGKTGTLSGNNPKGLYTWFVGALPLENPEIAVAALVIDNGRSRVNGSGLARRFLEQHYIEKPPAVHAKTAPKKKRRVS